MLNIAAQSETYAEVCQSDIGQGLPFRPGMFDGAISISAVQWLCYSDKKEHVAKKRLCKFFSTLYDCLVRGSRAVIQLYPETPEQMELISSCAMKSGFGGGWVVDFPNSVKAKKYYLCLLAGVDNNNKAPSQLPLALGVSQQTEIEATSRKRVQRKKGRRERGNVKARDWILDKKERQRQQGKKVRPDTKFTGRKRRDKM
jgi:18S rRNA (guanine1575-N7)-methyltransferase